MSENPYQPGKIGVTIKVPESKKCAGDNPWFVFEGMDPDELKVKIAQTFDIEHEGLTLAGVVINAQRFASGLGAVAHGLGGQVLPQGPATSSPVPVEAPVAAGGDVWAQAAASAPAAPQQVDDPILVSIDSAKTVAELQQIWAENQAAFGDAKYMDPWKAKGKSLQAA